MVDCYEKLNANAYRADLFRYSLIYLYGGCYVDIPYVFIDGISSVLKSNTKFFSAVDDQRNKLVVNSAFFCASPGHEIIRLIL
jgi:mannosyltransferase OCH1-like enzyme